MKYRNSVVTLAIAGAFVALPALADNPNNPKSPDSPYSGTVPVVPSYQPQDTTPQMPVVVAPDTPLPLREQRQQYHHGITHEPEQTFDPGLNDMKDAAPN